MSSFIEHALLASLVMFCGATVLSSIGFGIGIVASPFMLTFLDPRSVVVVINTASLVILLLVINRDRKSLENKEVLPMTVSGLAGVPFGVFALSSVHVGFLRSAIAFFTLMFAVGIFVSKYLNVRWRPFGMLTGFTVGAMLPAISVGGPLLALSMISQGWDTQKIRVSLATFFFVIESVAVAGYVVAGMLTTERLLLVLIVTPGALLGFYLSDIIVTRLNEQMFRRTVILVIIVTSLMILVREGYTVL